MAKKKEKTTYWVDTYTDWLALSYALNGIKIDRGLMEKVLHMTFISAYTAYRVDMGGADEGFDQLAGVEMAWIFHPDFHPTMYTLYRVERYISERMIGEILQVMLSKRDFESIERDYGYYKQKTAKMTPQEKMMAFLPNEKR